MVEIKEKYKDEVSEVRQVEQLSEVRKIGFVRPKRGHTLFEINLRTKEIQKATLEDQECNWNGNPHKNKKVIVKHDCTYISALNENNAIRKLLKSVNNAKK